jgi:hypothetical protein
MKIQRTEIHGRESNGRKFKGRKSVDGNQHHNVEHNIEHHSAVECPWVPWQWPMAMWSCNDVNLRYYNITSSRCCSINVVTLQAHTVTMLRHCCNTRRRSIATLLQHVSQERNGTIANHVAVALRRYCNMHCGNTASRCSSCRDSAVTRL